MVKKGLDHLNLLCDLGELSSLLTGSENIENFLQKTAVMVAKHLDADVCSIYLYDDGEGELVLRSTIGLNPTAVGTIRMKPGEGLVGTVFDTREAIHEASASRNPKFKYFEEANEDQFESFLAVPIVRGVEKIGVLVVEHVERDFFDDVDVLALRAIASQLAGAVENARLLITMQSTKREDLQKGPRGMQGLAFVKGEGVVVGCAYAPVAHYGKGKLTLLYNGQGRGGTGNIDDFFRAVKATSEELLRLQESFSERLAESDSFIFTAHFMMLKDTTFQSKVVERIEKGSSPEDAIRAVAIEYIKILSDSPHAYIREKVSDMEDLSLRLLANVRKKSAKESSVPRGRIVIARNIYPSDIMKLASEEVKGIVLVGGGVTSHVTILARSLQIPLVIADKSELLEIAEETPLLIDGDMGTIHIRPTARLVKEFTKRYQTSRLHMKKPEQAHPQTWTKDGERIYIMANINLLRELSLARDVNAEGVGLYRTEFPFIIRSDFPSEEEQYRLYGKLFEVMEDRPVTIRTLDVGGDKVLAYSDVTHETNPELGLRSIRFTLRQRDIFEAQVRAILRAAHGAQEARIMFPMISSIDEFQKAKKIIAEVLQSLREIGIPHYENPLIGLLIEVPSVIEILDTLAEEADFFSIGTNDFVQYLLAVDRSNEKVAEYYQHGHPSVLRSIARVVSIANSHGKEISLCGEMAHISDYVAFLIGIGLRRFSVDPQFIVPLQKTIEEITVADAEAHARELLEQTTIQAVQRVLKRSVPITKGAGADESAALSR